MTIAKKHNLLLISFLLFCNSFMKAQDEKEMTDLSFLKDQKNIRLEFSYNEMTINDEPEGSYVQKKVAELNEKNAGSGDKFFKKWNEQKNNEAPVAFAAWFHNNLEDSNFDCVMDFELPTYGAEPKPKTEKKPKPKYVCVVSLTSLNTGKGKVITPTLWLTCTFYENDKRDKILALLKSHYDYGRDQTAYDNRGNVKASTEGSWTKINDAYFKGGKFLAKQVKKGIRK